MTAVALLVLAVVVALAAVTYEVTGDRMLRSRTKRRVLVTNHDGTWFSGVLYGHDRRSLVLREVHTEAEGGAAVPVDGEVLILADDVAHIQFP